MRRGAKLLLREADMAVHPGQHIGIIGANGSGKSSLFKLLMGEVSADAGEIQIPEDWRIAHMVQELASSNRSALDYVLDGDLVLRQIEALIDRALATNDNASLAHAYERLDAINGYDAQSRAEQLLQGLGFHQTELQRAVNSFSGGWRIR